LDLCRKAPSIDGAYVSTKIDIPKKFSENWHETHQFPLSSKFQCSKSSSLVSLHHCILVIFERTMSAPSCFENYPFIQDYPYIISVYLIPSSTFYYDSQARSFGQVFFVFHHLKPQNNYYFNESF
jgi:hypothetical protein